MSSWEDRLSPRARERLAQVGEVKPISELGLTQESFKVAIQERQREKGLSFILALYQVLDEFVEKEIENSGVILACRKGCSHCCHQMITCTEIEIDEIVKYISGLPRETRIPLLRRTRGFISLWRDYIEKNRFEVKIHPFKPITDWHGKPCPFLNEEGACDIYPVRIIDCRTASSLIPCKGSGKASINIPTPLYEKGPGRCRFQSELWANNMILEKQQRKSGLPYVKFVQVTPLHHWLWMKRKEFS